jgi:hypothetical protein
MTWRGPSACRIETRLDACLEFLSTPKQVSKRDTARKSACATIRQRISEGVPPAQMAGAEDEFERARR